MKVHIKGKGRRTRCGKPIRSEEMNNHIGEIDDSDCLVCIKSLEAEWDKKVCL